MENLHLTYDDVVYRIPYRNLQIMMKDKLHTVYGEVDREVSVDEYYRLMGRPNPFKKPEEAKDGDATISQSEEVKTSE